MNHWSIKSGEDQRVRGGHPWVFSNELSRSPTNIGAGAPVILTDFKGQFLSYGYGHPNSLISFRSVSWNEAEKDFLSPDFFVRRIMSAWRQRSFMGYRKSFRLVFSEGDQLPGLILDRFVASEKQIFVIQISTAGMEMHFKEKALGILNRVVDETNAQKWSAITWDNTAVLMKNESKFRKLENLQVEEPKVLKEIAGLDLRSAPIELSGLNPNSNFQFHCDLIDGQKTGFFLDQNYNIELVMRQIEKTQWPQRPIRILDLCCYVGSWSTRLAATLKEKGLQTEVVLVDASKEALAFAQKNVKADVVSTIQGDVLECLKELPDKSFDIVVADPPAFVKNKKDLPQGKHAYLKLFGHSFRLTNSPGFMIACSCSGLFEQEDMRDVLRKSTQRAGRTSSLINIGGMPPDHPQKAGFPEGNYLKMFTFLAD